MIPFLTELIEGVAKRFPKAGSKQITQSHRAASQFTANVAASIPPEEIEAELRCQLHEALKHLDNMVDLLAVSAAQKKSAFDKTEQFIVSSDPCNPLYSPRINYRPNFRSFSVIWRRVWLKNPAAKSSITRYEHISPKLQKGAEDEENGDYSLHTFRAVKNEDLKALLEQTEKELRFIREAMRELMQMRFAAKHVDKSITKFFDATCSAPPEDRVRSSALGASWPFDESPDAATYVLDVERIRKRIDDVAKDLTND